jgi:uncharacterized protein (TIGR03067 family)
MRRLGFILSACLLAGCGVSHAATDADDNRAWQGTWNMVACTYNGEPQSGDVQWIVKNDRYTIRLSGKTGTDPHIITLDARQKHIDVFHHDTPKGTWGGSFKGIYEIQGNTLKVCYDLKGERYPKSLEAGRGSGQVLYTFQRVRGE